MQHRPPAVPTTSSTRNRISYGVAINATLNYELTNNRISFDQYRAYLEASREDELDKIGVYHQERDAHKKTKIISATAIGILILIIIILVVRQKQ